MKKKQSVPRLIEKHKKIISIYKVFACLSMASLLTMIVFMFAVERKPFQTVMIGQGFVSVPEFEKQMLKIYS